MLGERNIAQIKATLTVVVAAFAIGENLVLAAGIGGAIILVGVWLVNRGRESEMPSVQVPMVSEEVQ